MPYPDSPFNKLDTSVITTLKHASKSDKTNIPEEVLNLKWLCRTPNLTCYKVNTLKTTGDSTIKLITKELDRKYSSGKYKAEFCKNSNVITIKHGDRKADLFKFKNEIIVDCVCGAAVLRGAHIYAPGVLAMEHSVVVGQEVSVYVDMSRKCRKGFSKIYPEHKVFIANGLVKLPRDKLFGEKVLPAGVAIEITETISNCPTIGGDSFLPTGWAILQNLPSVVCIQLLNPQKGETILDMCAAPGHKTLHIAELIQNEGTLIAIDRTSSKVEKLKTVLEEFNAKALVFQADSCKILGNNTNIYQGPPFSVETFDRILLDAPCSALGKRPQLLNDATEKVIRSYVPLQRKLFSNAVSLLKSGGVLVYSTCTITLSENEGMAAWALKTFTCLKLVKPELELGTVGWNGSDLSDEDRLKVTRFGAEQEHSVGFFIACFIKNK